MRFVPAQAPAELVRRLRERRLAGRVERRWRDKARRRLPSWPEMREDDLGDDLAFCFAADLRLSDTRPYFIFIGDALWRFSGLYLAGKRRRETALIDVAAAKMHEAALNRAPVRQAGVLRLDGGGRVAFRCVVLPLADNGVDVTHVFGAASARAAGR